jgi:menaquinone-dependent protoporphyrinogen oxidase
MGRPMPTTKRHRLIALYYATRDGQSRRIAEHISRVLAESEALAPPQEVTGTRPAPADLAAASVVVLVAAVRYGRHLPEAERFLAAYRSLSAPPPLALASVNLIARKPAKSTATGNPYLRKLIARHRLTPALSVAFAGRLDYRRYGWLDRQIIRFIMLLTGGPTSPDTEIEYTSWHAVDEFAARITDLHRHAN